MNFKNNVIAICLIFFLPHAGLAQTANPQQYKYVFTVAKDGSGDFKYIQDAIDAMRVYPLASITLHIKNGIYNEKIDLPETNTDVTFIGESVDKTIINFDDYSGRGKLTTFTSYTAKISGDRFHAENITFMNSAGPVGQAVALYVDADKAVFRNCRFIGDQDTIFSSGENSRQYFDSCYIEGTTDFIFGPATAVFEDCVIKCKANSYITAPNTPEGKGFGFSFINCKITVDAAVSKVYLGRPWRAYAKSVFLRCDLPPQIAGEGWDNWSNADNEKTTFFAEYENKGVGSKKTGRVGWSKQLTDAEAKKYTVENIFESSSLYTAKESDWFLANSKPFR